LLYENWESGALQRALDGHASLSEDVDVVDQMLRPYDWDIQVGELSVGLGRGRDLRLA
jgi:hypothetical protein